MIRSRRFTAAMLGFTAYSYLATTVTAAWFLRRAHAVDAGRSLVWSAALYAPWLAVAGLVWLTLRRFGAEARGMTFLALLTPPATAATAWAMTAIDAAMKGLTPTIDETATQAIDRLPVTLLLYTATAAVGLAASHWRRAREQKAELARLREDLAAMRSPGPSPDSEPQRLVVSIGRRRMAVEGHDIEWIGSAANYAVIHWDGREGLVRETLQTLETRLAPLGVVRCHRSALVNLAHIRDLAPLADGAWRLTLDSGAELMVSRSCRDAFLARFRRGR